jgi:threonine dehydrogenase-like Zn-dependent dehydrogenase
MLEGGRVRYSHLHDHSTPAGSRLIYLMPREIVTSDGRSFRYREYDLPPLEPDQVRVRVEFAAPKHGTEGHLLTGSPFSRKYFDRELRMFLPRGEEAPQSGALPERRVGNMLVGTVTETGSGVSSDSVGDRVFGYGPIQEVFQSTAAKLRPLGGLSEVDAVCTDPAHVAFVALRDGNVRIGDDVAVFGLGAIGLLTVQVARAAGAARVFGIDPAAPRREYALAHGADAAFDPLSEDAAFQIKLATDRKGVDVSIETSGSGSALHEAVRCLRQCGIVVHVPWGPKDASPLHLDEEFHHNRPTIVGSQAVWDNPDRSHPLWDEERARVAAIDLFRRGLITGEGLVTPIVPFDAAAQALEENFHDPSRAIKLGVEF